MSCSKNLKLPLRTELSFSEENCSKMLRRKLDLLRLITLFIINEGWLLVRISLLCKDKYIIDVYFL